MDSGVSPRSALRWTIVALAAAASYVCWPLWPALVLAAWTAALARPLLARFERGLAGRRRAAAVLTLLLLVGVMLPLALVVLGVISGGQELLKAIAQSPTAKSALESIVAGGGGAESPLLPTVPRSVSAAIELVERFGSQGLQVLKNVAGAASKLVVGLFIYLCGAYVFLVDGAHAWRWLKRQSPLTPEHLERFRAAFQETGRGLIVGIGLTSATQGAVATLAYLSLGIPRWWVLGAITGVASILPLVGSALVWVPLTVGLVLTGHPAKALILAAIGIGVISTVDNVLRPVFARVGSLRMPMFLLLVAIFGGVAAFGAWGVILGPLIVRLLLEALELRRESETTTDVTSAL